MLELMQGRPFAVAFNACLLHVISLRELGVKANAKTAFKT